MRARRSIAEGLVLAGAHATAEVSGELALIGAIIRQALDDVKNPRPTTIRTSGAATISDQIDAIEFLSDPEAVGVFAGLLDIDEVWLQRELSLAAGLGPVDATPRLGERREPLPNERHLRLYGREPSTPTERRLVNPGDFNPRKRSKRKRPRHALYPAPDHHGRRHQPQSP